MKKLIAALSLVWLFTLPAHAAPALQAETASPGEQDCQRYASAVGKQHDPDFIRVTLDVPMDVDRYDDSVGRQRVATIYKGTALYESKPGARRVQFICLHSGERNGAVFLDYLPVSVENPDLTRHNQYESWGCRRQGRFQVTYNSVADKVYFRHDGRDEALDHVVSASGARYQNAHLVWWGKGSTAALYRRESSRERQVDVCRLQGVTRP